MGIQFSSFAIRGIDVSQFNGTIDWSKVSAHFSAVRVGYGRTIDTKFVTNWQNSKGRVKRIPYWYMDYYSNHISSSSVYGTSDADWGKAQANTCWNALKNDPEGIVFLDIENTNVTAAPAITTVATRAQTIAKAFLQEMDTLNGKTNGIYCSLGMVNWFASWFRDRPLWVAWYNEAQTAATVLAAVANKGWTGKCLIWQYASDGDVNDDGSADGISMGMQYSFLDLNGWLGSTQDYANLFNAEAVADVPLYKIKILIYNLLVRSGPGILYTRLRRADFPGEYNIYEEKNGYGRISATVSEWVSLSTDYVERLSSETDEEEEPAETALYKIKILIYNLLVRSGPGILYTRLRRADFPGEYNIYEEQNGYGRISSTASEWVSLSASYVERLDEDSSEDETEEEPAATPLYSVKILIYNLSVRTGPGILYTWLRRADFPGEYGIYEEKNGFGRISATASEWINLSTNYVQRLESKEVLSESEMLSRLWAAHAELH